MAKLTPVTSYKKDGTKSVHGYKLSLSKLFCEKYDFDKSELEIEYKQDKIIIKKRG